MCINLLFFLEEQSIFAVTFVVIVNLKAQLLLLAKSMVCT